MWPVRMDEDPGPVIKIISITPDVCSPVYNKAASPKLRGDSLGKNSTRKSSPDDQKIYIFSHEKNTETQTFLSRLRITDNSKYV